MNIPNSIYTLIGLIFFAIPVIKDVHSYYFKKEPDVCKLPKDVSKYRGMKYIDIIQDMIKKGD